MFGGLDLENADMLLGADFFLSHHVLVSNSQQKIYFTYNGGPVFMLNVKPQRSGGTQAQHRPRTRLRNPQMPLALGFGARRLHLVTITMPLSQILAAPSTFHPMIAAIFTSEVGPISALTNPFWLWLILIT